MPSAWTTSVLAGTDGQLWIGTREGLAWRHGGGFAAVPPTELPPSRVVSLAENGRGELFVALAEGLFRKPNGGRFERVSAPPAGPATAVFADPEDCSQVAYAAFGGTVGRLAEDGSWTFRDTGLDPEERIDALAVDESARLWASSTRHLLSRGPEESTFRNETPGVGRLTNALDRSFLALDRSRAVWVPTNSGLFRRREGRASARVHRGR